MAQQPLTAPLPLDTAFMGLISQVATPIDLDVVSRNVAGAGQLQGTNRRVDVVEAAQAAAGAG